MIANMLIGGGVLIGVLALFSGPIASGIGSLFSLATRKPATSQEANTDALDLEAFKRLQARMVRLKCKEGIAAVATVGQHFLHDAGAHE